MIHHVRHASFICVKYLFFSLLTYRRDCALVLRLTCCTPNWIFVVETTFVAVCVAVSQNAYCSRHVTLDLSVSQQCVGFIVCCGDKVCCSVCCSEKCVLHSACDSSSLSVLQRFAVSCSTLRHVAVWCSALQLAGDSRSLSITIICRRGYRDFARLLGELWWPKKWGAMRGKKFTEIEK